MTTDLFPLTLNEELTILGRMALAIFIGGILGFERRIRGRQAGIRTLSIVSLGACIFTLVSIFGFRGLGTVQDPARVAAQIVSGVGFIGAGTMIASASGVVRGLTTASSIWVAAALGMSAGVGLYVLTIAGGIATACILHFFPRNPSSPQG